MSIEAGLVNQEYRRNQVFAMSALKSLAQHFFPSSIITGFQVMHVWTLERTRRLCSASFGFARTIGTERDSCLLGPTYKHSACTWMTQNHELDHPDHRTAGYSIILWIEFTDHFLHHVHLRKFSSVTCSSFALQVCNKKIPCQRLAPKAARAGAYVWKGHFFNDHCQIYVQPYANLTKS